MRCVLVISGSERRQRLAPVNTAICHTEGYSFAENMGICSFCAFVNIGTHVADSNVAGSKLYGSRNVCYCSKSCYKSKLTYRESQ